MVPAPMPSARPPFDIGDIITHTQRPGSEYKVVVTFLRNGEWWVGRQNVRGRRNSVAGPASGYKRVRRASGQQFLFGDEIWTQLRLF